MEALANIRWSAVPSLRGRIGRRAFWLLAGPPLLVIFLVMWFAVLYAPNRSEAYDTLFFSGFAFALVIGFVGVRRLHDLGRPGWWMLFVVLPFPLAFLPILSNLLLLVPLILLVLLVMVGFLPGQDGVNAYGPPGSGSPFAHRRPLGETAQRRGRH